MRGTQLATLASWKGGTWFPAISANPFQSFFFKATESGEFTFTWKDDGGSEQKATAKLAVG